MRRESAFLVLFTCVLFKPVNSQTVSDKTENILLNRHYADIAETVASEEHEQSVVSATRGSNSQWFNYTSALSSWVTNRRTYYTLMFPDTVISVSEDNSNPGNFITGRVRNHSVGTVFSPASDMISAQGLPALHLKQPYSLDSFAIEYNYMRFSNDSIVDTLIINFFSPQKLLYYQDNQIPKGASVRYDTLNSKGRDYSLEIVYLLTEKDVVVYEQDGRGILYFGLSGFNITPSSFGNPVAITWTFNPGSPYTLDDSLNGSFSQSVPHSAQNHFLFWNFTDNDEYEAFEYNNGLFIYSWSNESRFLRQSTYGPLYWRGTSFSNRRCYPVSRFYITYDPDWVSSEEVADKLDIPSVFPNPATNNIFVNYQSNNSQTVEYEIFKITGQSVAQSSFNFESGFNRIELPLTQLEKGFYLLKFRSDDAVHDLKFVKQ